MCGIAGIIHLDGRPLDAGDAAILQRMGRAIRHRGPDDETLTLWNNVGFIFERLAIVDLAGGRQPFTTADGRVTAMINGEIYNHRQIRPSLAQKDALRTHSDCEVIPYLYLERGRDLFDPVNGMFAMALLDRQERRVLLARDRLGIKPLFYAVTDASRTFVFGSEIKALLAHPGVARRFDWVAALTHDASAYCAPRELPSCFETIKRVPAGSILELALDSGEIAVKRYWSIPPRANEQELSAATDYEARFRELLEDSVRLRLMADVGCGVFLSGGIDSAVVAALAAKSLSLPTFSVLCRSTIVCGDAAASLAVADALGLPNHQVCFDLDDGIFTPDDWRRVLWACELPTATAEQLYKYHLHAFARQRYPDLKVMLLGQGSDEFLGGYMETFLTRRYRRDDDWDALGRELRARETAQLVRTSGIAITNMGLFERGVLDPDYLARAAGYHPNRTTWDLYAGACRQNLDYHLWHEDRTAAAHAVENRVPFIDYRIIEFLASIPERCQPALFSDKRILRRAARALLPARIAERPKGFFFYGEGQHHTFRMMYELLTQDGGSLIEQALEGSARTDGPLDPDRFREYAASVARDRSYADLTRLLDLVNMGILAELASSGACAPTARPELPIREVTTADWQSWLATHRAPNEQLSDHLADTTVVALAAGVNLIELQAGVSGEPARRRWYLAMGGKPAEPVDNPGWHSFLAALDGRKSIWRIAADQHLNVARTKKRLRDVIDRKLVVRVEG
jgi:asparagine synthase (glutamine-hydrolysing)